jgi:hypothetical protein
VSRARWLVLFAGCLVGVAACSSAPDAGTPPGEPLPSLVPATGTFLAVDVGPRGTVQLRRFGDGQVVRTLLTARNETASATRAADGSVVVALTSTSGGCRSRIERLDPATGTTELLRTTNTTMSDIALSPNGRHLAYRTYPSCAAATPLSCAGRCNGPARYLPNVLGVLDLTTGAAVSGATDNPGHPIFGISWNPDGRRLRWAPRMTRAACSSSTRPDRASLLHRISPLRRDAAIPLPRGPAAVSSRRGPARALMVPPPPPASIPTSSFGFR